MSTATEDPTPACPQTGPEACPAPLAPVASLTAAERPPRPAKSALVPEIARLALAGYSGREIGKRLGVPRRTVARWLQELRQEWAARAAEDAAQLVPVTLARLELAYREAVEAWQRSLADKETTTETPGGDDGATPRICVRRATQSGQAALLGKVIHAAKEIYAFKQKHLYALREAEAAERNRVCRELAEELRILDKSEFRETEFILATTGRHVDARDPEELAEVINRLSIEEYRKLRSVLRNEYGRRVPYRRAVPSPEDVATAAAAVEAGIEAVAAEAAADPSGLVPSESGHSPG
jgi:transcriptional regulator with XRE-family HTH domain